MYFFLPKSKISLTCKLSINIYRHDTYPCGWLGGRDVSNMWGGGGGGVHSWSETNKTRMLNYFIKVPMIRNQFNPKVYGCIVKIT
jgi:hypothetical protein